MLEIVEVIFRSFWTWAGTVILVAAVSNVLSNTILGAINGIRGRTK